MKRKTIYSLLVITILMGSLIPLQTQAVADMVAWHSSLDDKAIIWRITNQFLYDPADPHSLAGEDLFIGSTFGYEINDTLPTIYDDVYNTGLPPNFFKLFVNWQEVDFFDVGPGEPSFALQFLVLPYLFYPAASGGVENITQLLEYRTSFDPNITAIDYVITGGNYVTVDIYNDFFSSFQVTYNNDTGICANFFLEDSFGELFGQLDIWESEIDDAGVDLIHTLNFHSNLGAGTVLSWKYTEITYDPLASDVMKVNNVTLAVDHLFSFEYAAIPTDPMQYYGGDYGDPSASFFDVYFEGDPAEFDHMSRVQFVLWLTLINPLSLTLYNATVISMDDIHYIRDWNDPGIQNTTVSVVGDSMNLAFDFEEENDLWAIDLDIKINSGIVSAFSADILGFVHFEMEFVPTESSVLIDGSVNTDFPPDDENGTRTLPGFNWFYMLFFAIIVIPIIRRRK